MANGRSRARMDRAVSTEGTELHQDALAMAAESLNDVITTLRDQAKKGDVQASKALLELASTEIGRARSGANDPLLLRILEIREAGSQIEYDLWEKLYRNGVPTLEEPI